MKTPLDTASIIERYNDGVGLRNLGIACHCNPARVREVLVAAGVAIRPQGKNNGHPPRDVTALEAATIVERYRAGAPIKRIYGDLKRSYETIRAVLEAADVPIRPRGIQKAGVKPLWRTCRICDIRIPAVDWHEHQRTTHAAPATPTAVIRRNVAAYIKAYEAKPTPALPYCIGCRQRPCITPTCCGRRLRAQTQHANRKVL